MGVYLMGVHLLPRTRSPNPFRSQASLHPDQIQPSTAVLKSADVYMRQGKTWG
jgi:hypothetical protein